MFTVRHIHPSSGDETLRQGDYVNFDSEAQRLTICSHGDGVNGTDTFFDDGDNYVMNAAGQTVATYHLGEGR